MSEGLHPESVGAGQPWSEAVYNQSNLDIDEETPSLHSAQLNFIPSVACSGGL